MNRKFIIYLSVALFATILFGFKYSHYQDENQVMTIVYDRDEKAVTVSTEFEVKQIKFQKQEFGSYKEVLKLIADYKKQGWTVKSSNGQHWSNGTASNFDYCFFYLEK